MKIQKRIQWYAKTDIGLKRKTNEDNIKVIDSSTPKLDVEHLGLMFAVADGMGGHAAGEIASQMACDALITYYNENSEVNQRPDSDKTLVKHLDNTIRYIDRIVSERSIRDKDCEHMGTTLSVLVLTGKTAIIGHVGDSRIYRLRGKKFDQMTVDQTFVQEMIDEGELKPSDVPTHPLRGILTNVIGTKELIEYVFTDVSEIQQGDIFLLCTDGLHDMLSNQAILETLSNYPDPNDAATQLVKSALINGGKDNIAVIVIRI